MVFGEKRVKKYEFAHNLSEEELQVLAIRRLRIKKRFLTHFGIYAVTNIGLLGINMMSSWEMFWQGDMWFLWVALCWGIGLGCHYVTTVMKLRITENGNAIQKEMDYLRGNLNNSDK